MKTIQSLAYLISSFVGDIKRSCRQRLLLHYIEQRDGCSLSPLARITGTADNIHFGRNTRVNSYCQFRCKEGKIWVGSNVLFGQFISVIAHSYNYADRDRLIIEQGMYSRDVVIEDDVWIGAYSIIMPGVKVGKGAVVGASSVVSNDIPPYEVWAGIPARKINDRKSGK